MKPTPRVSSLFSLLAIVAAVLGHASQASAQATEFINVPAIAFTAGTALYLAAVGEIEGVATDVARAPVQFTKPGLRICRFRMWAHDNDPAGDPAGRVTARLIRKRITSDASSATGPAPEEIASVSSTGSSDTMRSFGTFAVSAPTVSASYFYWVQLNWDGTIQVSGLRIETATDCG